MRRIFGSVILLMITLSFICGCTAREERALYVYPLTAETIESELVYSELDWNVALEEEMSENQKAFTLHNAEGKTKAFISNAGKDEGRFLQMSFMETSKIAEAVSEDEIDNVMKLASVLYGGFKDENKLYNDFMNALEKEEFDNRWIKEYDDFTCAVTVGKSDDLRISDIVLYNTEEFNPYARQKDEADYGAPSPVVSAEEINEDVFLESFGIYEYDFIYDNFEGEYKFYKVSFKDSEFSKNYPIDVAVYAAVNLDDETVVYNMDHNLIGLDTADGYKFNPAYSSFSRKDNVINCAVVIPRVEVYGNDGKLEFKEAFDYHATFKINTYDLTVSEIKNH